MAGKKGKTGKYIRTKEMKEKISWATMGKKKSLEHRKRMSESKKGLIGEKANAWKGGIKRNYHREMNEKEINIKREKDRIYAKGKRKEIRKNRRKIDAKFRLDSNMSSLISQSLKGKKAGRSWKKLAGYFIEDLIKHLESKFDNKMSWDNYGSYWWIDHIKARSLFKYETAEDPEFKKCWALENLQPLEKIKNIKKGNKF